MREFLIVLPLVLELDAILFSINLQVLDRSSSIWKRRMERSDRHGQQAALVEEIWNRMPARA